MFFVKTNDACKRSGDPSATNTSENQLNRELYLASGAGRAQDLTELRVLYAVIRRAVVGVVAKVEELSSERRLILSKTGNVIDALKYTFVKDGPNQIISVQV